MERPYSLSIRSVQDLEEIFDRTVESFGIDQAESYLLKIDGIMNDLAKYAGMGRERVELGDGVKSYPLKSHTIIYTKSMSGIRVLRVLHGHQDINDLRTEG